jgi:outer membrane protein insertion porin family
VDGAIALASISQSNLFGLGKRVALSGQIGQNANRLNAIYSDPHFWDTDFLVEPRIYALSTSGQETTQGFNQSTEGVGLSVGHLLVERVFGLVGYTYERVHIKDVADNAPFLIKQQATESGGVSKTSAMAFNLSRDTRDSFAEPTKGLLARASAVYAGGALDAENNFVKYNLELSQYAPLWWKLVGHIRGSIMYGDSFGDTPALPAQERYFLGGINTIRGFRNFTISPEDPVTGGRSGGNKAFFINNEMLFPLYEALKMRGLVFFDLGNAFDERQDFEWSVKRSVGVGIHFTSPIGAIRLEWGFNLAPQAGEKLQVLHFTAGSAF